jgi:transposase-like protein
VLTPKGFYPIFANINYIDEIHVKLTRFMKDIIVNLLLSLVNFLLKRERPSEILPLSTYQNEALPQPICPKCGSSHTLKNGSMHHGKKKYKCKDCGDQLIENPTNMTIPSETKQCIDKLLLERIS